MTWRNSGEGHIPYGMTMIPPTLVALPALVTLAVAAGRIVAPLAREVRVITVVWLALRGTRPDDRTEIIRALTGGPQQSLVNDSARQLPAGGGARRQSRVSTVASDNHIGQRRLSGGAGVANGPALTRLPPATLMGSGAILVIRSWGVSVGVAC